MGVHTQYSKSSPGIVSYWTMKLWGGRFSGEADPAFDKFNRSFPFDKRLLAADIEGSRGYAQSLLEAGILNSNEARDIESGLTRILRRASEDPGGLAQSDSDGV